MQSIHKVSTVPDQYNNMGKIDIFYWYCIVLYSNQLLGAAMLAIGIYVQVETAFEMLELSSVLTNPAIVLIIFGCLLFILGFCGCLGALLEIFFLLVIVSWHNKLFVKMVY